uniref:Uncharacterized protein n=1 Tax=Rhodnius prolixus TaxID=13249 RepID=T1HZM8_RHOPR
MKSYLWTSLLYYFGATSKTVGCIHKAKLGLGPATIQRFGLKNRGHPAMFRRYGVMATLDSRSFRLLDGRDAAQRRLRLLGWLRG